MSYKDKRILVAGGSGFVGINLCKRLVDLGADVTATFHNAKRDRTRLVEDVSWEYTDLTDATNCQLLCAGREFDYVFMCAANTSGAAVMETTPLVHVTPNVVMNSLLLEAAYRNGVEKFMFLSSNTVYPLSYKPLKEEDSTGEFFHKYFFVAHMKKFTETLCEMYGSKIKNPMTSIVVRPGNLYGPYDDFEWETSHSTPALIRRVVERHSPLEVWGDGSDRKDLMYIDDFIDGILLAMEKIDGFDIVNIASGKAYSIKETLETALRVDGYEEAEVVYDPSKPTMIPLRLIDITKARRLLDFDPKISLEDGMRRTIEWYRKELNDTI